MNHATQLMNNLLCQLMHCECCCVLLIANCTWHCAVRVINKDVKTRGANMHMLAN
jgi:hypothetical protein